MDQEMLEYIAGAAIGVGPVLAKIFPRFYLPGLIIGVLGSVASIYFAFTHSMSLGITALLVLAAAAIVLFRDGFFR